MLVRMSKERFVERMLKDAERRKLLEKEKKRRLEFELNDYIACSHRRAERKLMRHRRFYG